MKAFAINVQPFVLLDVLDLEIRKGVNTHGFARIKGVIDEAKEQSYLSKATQNVEVSITALDMDGSNEVLFIGILQNISITNLNGLRVAEVFIEAYSKAMDLEKRVRVFQNTGLNYRTLVDSIMSKYSNPGIIMNSGGGAIGQMLVQYQETDWEFLCRMASMFNDVVVPNHQLSGTKLYFGFQKSSRLAAINPISYKVKKLVGEYIHKKENSVAVSESDLICYQVKDREIRHMGDNTSMNGVQLYVTEIHSFWEGSELVHEYTLMPAAGVRVPQKRNFDIIGMSLSGNISDVSGAHVKVSLPNAYTNDVGAVKWMAYSTVYSSPDGSGWYAMPEKGDSVRLYFPTEIENEAYVMSSVHTDAAPVVVPVMIAAPAASGGGSGGGTSAPAPAAASANLSAGAISAAVGNYVRNQDVKEISNSTGYLKMGKGFVEMASVEGGDEGEDATVINRILMNGEGITIYSAKEISFDSDQGISVVSRDGEVLISAGKSVTITQGSAAVELTEHGEVIFTGTEILTE